MNAKNTPLPWEVITDDADGNRSAAHYGRRTIVFSPGSETIVASTYQGAANGQSLEEAEANAELIARACRSHSSLVAVHSAANWLLELYTRKAEGHLRADLKAAAALESLRAAVAGASADYHQT